MLGSPTFAQGCTQSPLARPSPERPDSVHGDTQVNILCFSGNLGWKGIRRRFLDVLSEHPEIPCPQPCLPRGEGAGATQDRPGKGRIPKLSHQSEPLPGRGSARPCPPGPAGAAGLGDVTARLLLHRRFSVPGVPVDVRQRPPPRLRGVKRLASEVSWTICSFTSLKTWVMRSERPPRAVPSTLETVRQQEDGLSMSGKDTPVPPGLRPRPGEEKCRLRPRSSAYCTTGRLRPPATY